MTDSGSSTYSSALIRSTQKLPNSALERLAKPRAIAIPAAIPTAPLRKPWTAIPAIWEKFESVRSPPKNCQPVLLTNDDAVLKLRSQGGEPKPWGLSGWIDWVRRTRYSASQETALNISTLPAYPFQS